MINRLVEWFERDDKDKSIVLLICAILVGVNVGLAVGFGDIVFGLIVGGLLFGIVSLIGISIVNIRLGLLIGILSGLSVGLGTALINLDKLLPKLDARNIIGLIIGVIIIAEILFTLNDKKKKVSWEHVIWLKIDAVFCSMLIWAVVLNLNWVMKHITPEIVEQIKSFCVWLFIVILCTIAAGLVIYLWLLINKMILTKKNGGK